MPIDTSIYSNIRQPEKLDLTEPLRNSLNLSNMAMQNAAAAQKMKQSEQQRKLLMIGNAIDDLASIPEDKRADAYKEHIGNLVKIGELKQDEDHGEYDPSFVRTVYSQLNASPEYQQMKHLEAETQKLKSDNEFSAKARDPNSDISKSIQNTSQKIGLGDLTNGLSYDQYQKVAPLIEKNQEAKMRYADRQDRMDSKKDEIQGKAYSELRNRMETFRGNQAAQQAARDVYSADKTVAMVANKDPNTLTTQDLSLLAGEMAKIATGGVPTEHGIQQLMPNNLNTKMAELQSFLMSKPSDAEAGEYIKKNMEYLKEMSGEANKVLKSYRTNILKGYKGRVSEDQYNEAVLDYGLEESPKNKEESSKSIRPKGSKVSDVEIGEYAIKHNMKASDAKAYLKEQGYAVD